MCRTVYYSLFIISVSYYIIFDLNFSFRFRLAESEKMLNKFGRNIQNESMNAKASEREREREGTLRTRKRRQEEEQQMLGNCESLSGFYLLYGVVLSQRNS